MDALESADAHQSLGTAKTHASICPEGGCLSLYIPMSDAAKRRLVAIVLHAKHSEKCDFELNSFTLDVNELLGMVQSAVSRLDNRKMFSMPPARFRAILRGEKTSSLPRDMPSLRSAIEQLIELLPANEYMPPWPQMRAQFSGGNPFSDGSDRVGEKSREEFWADHLHPATMKKALTEYISLMDQLRELSAGTRPPQVPERMFVEELAEYWTTSLGLPIRNGRGPGERQRGQFAEFVREARKLHVQHPDHPELNIASLDGHTRSVARAHNLAAKRRR